MSVCFSFLSQSVDRLLDRASVFLFSQFVCTHNKKKTHKQKHTHTNTHENSRREKNEYETPSEQNCIRTRTNVW